MSLRNKLLIVFLPLLIILIFSLGTITYLDIKKSILKQSYEENKQLLFQKVFEVRSFLNRYIRNIEVISRYPAIQGIIRARPTGVDLQEATSLQLWKQRLQNVFISIAEVDSNIAQLRYLDEDGNELVRVNSYKKNITVTPDAELQNKKTRDYVDKTLRLTEEDLYVSPIDLNVEHGEIEIPHVPVIRVAKPIFSKEDRSLKGMVVINIKGEELFKFIQQTKIGNTVFIDQDGHFLISLEQDRNFAHLLGKTDNYFTDNPKFKDNLKQNDKFLFYDTLSRQLRIWDKIFYDPNDQSNYWVLVTVVSEEELLAPLNKLSLNLLKVTVLFVLLFIGIIVVVARLLFKPITELTTITNQIEEGNFELRAQPRLLKQNDEIGELSRAFNAMTSKLKSTTVSKDRLEEEIVQRKEKEEMLRRETVLKKNISELNDKMRGEQGLEELGNNILTYLIGYLYAQIGAIYIVDKGKIVLLDAYAYQTGEKNIVKEFLIGERLIGEAARDKKDIFLTDVPDDYIKVSSSLGESKPKNIIIMPIFFEGNTKGVIEIGSLKQITDEQIKFLKIVNENIGISLMSAQSRVRLQELLSETQTQAEELQVQQEELRTTNEELEEQTKNLKGSQTELQSQQEELQQINEELAEQRDYLKEKNEEIENAGHLIALKAKELEATNRYKSEFLANMSHELRTPLNSMLILSKMLYQSKNLESKQVEFAETIHQAGTELLNLINEILDLSKVEAGKLDIYPEEIELSEFIQYIRKNFQHVAEHKHLSLNVHLEDNLPEKIVTDRQRLEQILKNLISNAIKFTAQGGITVVIQRPENDVNLERSGLAHQKTIMFSIVDTGAGIALEQQDLIFEAFQQADGSTNRKFGGTGLGLTISRELAKCLGGEIQLKSEKGRGSVFSLYVPEQLKIISEDQTIKEQMNAFTESVEKNKNVLNKEPDRVSGIIDDRRIITDIDKTVLIIEDDVSFAKILLNAARENGFKGLIAPDGKTGLYFADYYQPKAILLDIGLPDMDGLNIMDELHKNPSTRSIPVHVLSGMDRHQETMRRGAVECLKKPVSLQELEQSFRKIERVITGQVKKVLLVEDNEIQQKAIIEIFKSKNIEIVPAGTGSDALKLLHEDSFGCIILDITLPDMTGFELLEYLKKDGAADRPPLIVYTGKDLSKREEEHLCEYAESIIIKSPKSQERLLNETTLFLDHIGKFLLKNNFQNQKTVGRNSEIFRDKKILIADDDMRNVFALTHVLEEQGIKVFVGRNGREALDCLNEGDNPDLVLMDIMMPEMDGYEAMRTIRKNAKFQKLPIIALTAKAMKGDKEKCLQAGASDYLPKPVDIDQLLSLIRVWLYK